MFLHSGEDGGSSNLLIRSPNKRKTSEGRHRFRIDSDSHLTTFLNNIKCDPITLVGVLNSALPILLAAQEPETGNTPLHLACREGNTEALALFLAWGIPQETRNRAGETAAMIAHSLTEGRVKAELLAVLKTSAQSGVVGLKCLFPIVMKLHNVIAPKEIPTRRKSRSRSHGPKRAFSYHRTPERTAFVDGLWKEMMNEAPIFHMSEKSSQETSSSCDSRPESATESEVESTTSMGLLSSAYGVNPIFEIGSNSQCLSRKKNSMNEPIEMNQRFQEATEQLFKIEKLSSEDSSKPKKILKVSKSYVDIIRDFLSSASSVGKIIISETFVPFQLKTIKPVNLGGTLGGEKYIVHDILFKHAVDQKKMFGMDVASKIAGHELKAVGFLWDQRVEDLCFPLICLVDYLGFRVSAMLKLPIDETTLSVGTSDAGYTFSFRDPKLIRLMSQVGQKLNLAPHTVSGAELYLPADVEGHVGKDGRRYLVDLSRCLPPTLQSAKSLCKYGYLYQLFRYEFLQIYRDPLCTDTYSKFLGQAETLIAVKKTSLAQKFLENELIPKAAKKLDEMIPVFWSIGHLKIGNLRFDLGAFLHQYGINLRYLGYVFRKCLVAQSRWIIMVEILFRSMKSKIQEKWREIMEETGSPSCSRHISFLCEYINRVLVHKKEEYFDDLQCRFNAFHFKGSTPMLKDVLWNAVFSNSSFGLPLSPRGENEKPSFAISMVIGKLFEVLGIHPTKSFFQNLKYLDPTLLKNYKKDKINFMTESGVLEFRERVKHMNLIDHARASLFKFENGFSVNPQLQGDAIHFFESAYQDSPRNKITLRNLAVTYCLLWRNTHGVLSDRQVVYLKYLFESAIESDKNDTHSLYLYADFLFGINEFEKAEEYACLSVIADRNHLHAWRLFYSVQCAWGIQDAKTTFIQSFLKNLLPNFTEQNMTTKINIIHALDVPVTILESPKLSESLSPRSLKGSMELFISRSSSGSFSSSSSPKREKLKSYSVSVCILGTPKSGKSCLLRGWKRVFNAVVLSGDSFRFTAPHVGHFEIEVNEHIVNSKAESNRFIRLAAGLSEVVLFTLPLDSPNRHDEIVECVECLDPHTTPKMTLFVGTKLDLKKVAPKIVKEEIAAVIDDAFYFECNVTIDQSITDFCNNFLTALTKILDLEKHEPGQETHGKEEKKRRKRRLSGLFSKNDSIQ